VDDGLSIRALREGRLELGQPAEGGWHFYASDEDPARAQLLVSAWARSFAETAQANISSQQGLSSFVKLEVTQSGDLPVKRSVPLGTYLLAGTLGAWLISALAVLFFDPGQLRPQ
jgi:hypothetical protein